jgi:peptidoglycan/LPS O-acetylase OafA/YrhL
MVVVFHTIEAWGRILRGDPTAADGWPNGAAGVDLFFVISGLVMMISVSRRSGTPRDWKAFMRGRIERIVPLYWLMSGLKLLQMAALPGLTPHLRLVWWNAVATFLFIPSRDGSGAVYPLIAAGWSLNLEMLFYVLFAAAIAIGGSPLRTILPVLLSPAGLARAAVAVEHGMARVLHGCPDRRGAAAAMAAAACARHCLGGAGLRGAVEPAE